MSAYYVCWGQESSRVDGERHGRGGGEVGRGMAGVGGEMGRGMAGMRDAKAMVLEEPTPLAKEEDERHI